MKKLLIILLALFLLLSFVACGDKHGDTGESDSDSVATESDILGGESESTDSESKKETEDDDWLIDEEDNESQTVPDRWTNNH